MQISQTSLLDAFLSRPFTQVYHPTIKPRTAVNSVELHGGKQCYLIVSLTLATSSAIKLIYTPSPARGTRRARTSHTREPSQARRLRHHLLHVRLVRPQQFLAHCKPTSTSSLPPCHSTSELPANGLKNRPRTMQKTYPRLDDLPAVYAALKADQDKTMQRSDLQPDDYTRSLNMAAPLHVSVTWNTISDLFVHVSIFPSHSYTLSLPKLSFLVKLG